MEPTVRPMLREDVGEACRLLNDIIEIGGTTALEIPFSEPLFAQSYFKGDDKICCHVALDSQGQVAGFQWLGLHDALPDDCADIATFARRTDSVRGVGRALFSATRDTATKLGFKWINATIRADNGMGLRYYSKMGFQDHSVRYGVPLRGGRPVDRISKRYQLKGELPC